MGTQKGPRGREPSIERIYEAGVGQGKGRTGDLLESQAGLGLGDWKVLSITTATQPLHGVSEERQNRVEGARFKVTWQDVLCCTKKSKLGGEHLARNLSGSRFPHPWFHIGLSELQSHFSLNKDLKTHKEADLRATVPCHSERRVVTSKSRVY